MLVQRFVINRTLFLSESSPASLLFLDVATATPAKKRLAYERFILRIESSYYKIAVLEPFLLIQNITFFHILPQYDEY